MITSVPSPFCGQLQSLVPALEYHYLTGRLQFLIALAHTWDLEGSLAHWDLPIGPKPDGMRGISHNINFVVLYLAGLKDKIQRDHYGG